MHIIRYSSIDKITKDSFNILGIAHMKGSNHMEPLQIIAQSINAILDSLPKRPSAYGTLDLSKEPLFLKRTHRYSQVFLTNPIDLFVDIPRLGEFLLSFPIGWNDLSLPEGTTLALASGNTLSALYRSID